MSITISSIKLAQMYQELLKAHQAPSESIVISSNDFFATYKIEKISINKLKELADACETVGYVTSDWLETPFTTSIGWLTGLSLKWNDKVALAQIKKLNVYTEEFADSISVAWASSYYLSRSAYEPLVTKITDNPVEVVADQVTYRILASPTAQSTEAVKDPTWVPAGSTKPLVPGVFVATHISPIYNYLDKGRFLVFYRRGGKLIPLALDEINCDIYKLLILIGLAGTKLQNNPLEDTPYLDVRNKREFIRTQIQKLEKIVAVVGKTETTSWSVQSMFKDYFVFTASITYTLMCNAKNSLYAKLMAGEIASFKIDDMDIAKNKVSYETVSVECEWLAEMLKHQLVNRNSSNDNVPLTIYNIVTDVVTTHITRLHKDAESRFDTSNCKNVLGFKEDKEVSFKINDIPITLSISTKDTRRRINGYRINESELKAVLNHATCYHSIEQYNLFLRDVQNMSLLARNALTNGVFMKFETLGTNNDCYELKRPATPRHPKLKFIMRDNQVYLIHKPENEEPKYFKVNRFTSCVQWLQTIDRKTRIRSDGITRTDRLKREFCAGIGAFCPDLTGAPATKEAIIRYACADRIKAKQRSEKLLIEIVEQLGCTEAEAHGEKGYLVKGKLRSYFVSKEPPFKVWNHDTGKYICIVNGNSYEGVGYDALVSRLLALANDQYAVSFISTLKAA
jgi:hypothetical protein